MTSVVDTRGLTKLFSGDRGVRDIHLEVRQGQVFGFLGPNGAGKSTFVKMLVGLLRPTVGEAQVLGLPAGHLDARRRIGYLPELFRYQPWLTGEEVLRYHARLCNMSATRATDRIAQVVSDVGLGNRARDRVRGYSKGMQQRLGLACALLNEPDVLFLDEPASALDPGGRHEVRELILSLQHRGMTIFLNTHLLEDVEQICDHVALLVDGRIRANGNVSDILHPEPIWSFVVGGWEHSMLSTLQAGATAQSPLRVEVSETLENGMTVIHVPVHSLEQVAYINEQLVELGLSVYKSVAVQNSLESWFIRLTEGESAAK